MDSDQPQTLAELLESDIIKCKVCLRPLTEAKILPCLDTLCTKCLKSVLNQQNDNQTSCPICYEKINIKEHDILKFKNNVFFEDLSELAECKNNETKYCDYCNYAGHKVVATGWCLDCKDSLCTTCTSAHEKTKVTRSHTVAPFKEIKNHRYDHNIRETQVVSCSQHVEQVLTEFCTTCNELICLECKSGDHKDHVHTLVTTASSKLEEQLKTIVENLGGKDPDFVKYIDFLKCYIEDMNKREKTVEEQVKDHAEMLHKLIEEQKDRMLESLHTRVTTEVCEVENKMKKMSQTLSTLRGNLSFVNILREHGRDEEMLFIQNNLLERMTRLLYLNPEADGISTKLSLDFIPGNANEQNIEVIFGQIYKNDNSVGGKSTRKMTGKSIEGLTISSILPTLNTMTELMQEFEAHSAYDEKDVWPTGLAVTEKNEYVIVDRENKRVKIYDSNGNFIHDFTGEGDNKLGCPYDAAVMKNGNIAITDYETDDVKIFKLGGKYVNTISGYFKHPRGITVNSKGQLIVLDCGTLQVTLHDPNDGKLISTIKGQDEEGFEYFSDPYYVAVTANDNIIVTDWAAPNIKVFSPDGKYLAKYGTYGIKQDQVLEPYGVCADAFGYIFIADNQNHRIHLLLPDGRFQKFILSKMNGLWHPMALAINKEGHLVITEALGKVRVYKYI